MPDKIPPKNGRAAQIKRLAIVCAGLFLCYGLLIAHFYKIQIQEKEIWQEKADRQHYFTVTEPFMRGTFYTNSSVKKGHPEKPLPIVMDVEKFHLYVDSASIPAEHRAAIAHELIAILNIDPEEQKAFEAQFAKKSRSRKLAKWLDSHQSDRILSWWRPYARKHKIASNALFFVSDYQRSYPFGKLLGQVLHTIQDTKDEQTKQGVPTGGLELYFNDYLKGKQGKRRMMRSPRHSFETGEVVERPENGADIYLTINHCLQAICEEELEKGVKFIRAKSGWAVMMNPRTGEVYSVAQYPFFDPPSYQEYFNDKNLIQQASVRAATDAYEPASPTKAMTIAIALLANEELKKRGEAPLFDPEEMMPTANGRFPGRSRPIKDTRLHHYLNMDMAIHRSSNIYCSRLMERLVGRLGNEWYRNALQDIFGFGKKTNIELPSETSGVLPRLGKKHPNGCLEWSVPTPFSLAIGYNFQASTFQMVRAFACFANGGFFVQPTLVRKIVQRYPDGSEKVLVDHTTEEWLSRAPRVLPEKIVDRVVHSLKFVTKPGGAAWRGDVWGYTEVGKTGTQKKIVDGKYSNESYCPSFIGFTPAKDPAFILMVVVDEPDPSYRSGIGYGYYGSVSAASIFKNIAQRSLEYLGIPMDDPHGFSPEDPRFNKDLADWHPEAKLLNEKYDKWNKNENKKTD